MRIAHDVDKLAYNKSGFDHVIEAAFSLATKTRASSKVATAGGAIGGRAGTGGHYRF